jgi:hypothetical protein
MSEITSIVAHIVDGLSCLCTLSELNNFHIHHLTRLIFLTKLVLGFARLIYVILQKVVKPLGALINRIRDWAALAV